MAYYGSDRNRFWYSYHYLGLFDILEGGRWQLVLAITRHQYTIRLLEPVWTIDISIVQCACHYISHHYFQVYWKLRKYNRRSCILKPTATLILDYFPSDSYRLLFMLNLILPPTTITCPNADVSGHILVSRYIRIKTSNSGWREYW
jgi:hypothetical protein